MHKLLVWLFAFGCLARFPAAAAAAGRLRVDREPGAVLIRNAGGELLLRYQLERPVNSPLTVESGCYFHPLLTPNGVSLTDVAPADHLHHRGVFLGWVEMHERKDADFWGWGEQAPVKGRRILSKSVTGTWMRVGAAGFEARNEWQADDDPLLQEELEVEARVTGSAQVLELVYRLRTDEDLVLSRWAFGGFCVRGRKDGTVEVQSPAGVVSLADPVHTKPETDWPDAAWYDMVFKLPDGSVAGFAVISHAKNPPTLWYNHRENRMLNPAITAPGPVLFRAKKPVVLRYRVVAHDGPTPRELLRRLAADWGKS